MGLNCFGNLYGSYIAPRPQLYMKKPGNFSFDNIGPLKNVHAFIYLEYANYTGLFH